MANPPEIGRYRAVMSQPQPPIARGCYRHPDRLTYIGCQRCGRPICGECMINAQVGFQCPDCVAQGSSASRQPRGPYGGTRSARPQTTTLALIGVNLAIWLGTWLSGGYSSRLANSLMLLPAGHCALVQEPGSYLPGVGRQACALDPARLFWQPGVADGALWQVLTSAFTHVELIHLGLNMLSLWFLGPALEAILGRTRFLAVYLFSALAASTLVVWLADPGSQTLGASGAVFGLIGAMLVLAVKLRGDVRTVLLWLGINLAFTFWAGSSISWQGHVGGLLGGLAASVVIVLAPRTDRAKHQFFGLLSLTLGLIAAILLRVMQLR